MGETEDVGKSRDFGRRSLDARGLDLGAAGLDLDADRLREECGIFGISAIPTPPPSPLLDCMPCNIAAKRRRASSRSTAKDNAKRL